jgi:hypothetical protein
MPKGTTEVSKDLLTTQTIAGTISSTFSVILYRVLSMNEANESFEIFWTKKFAVCREKLLE